MEKVIMIKRNIRVCFDDFCEFSPYAELQFRIKFLFVFYRWVTVNSVGMKYYDRNGAHFKTQSEMVKTLLHQGVRNKCLKLRDRRFKRKLEENK